MPPWTPVIIKISYSYFDITNTYWCTSLFHMHRAYIINAQSTNLQYTISITSLPIYNNFNTSVVILLILNICDQTRLLLITKGYFTYHAINPLQIQICLCGLVGKWISAMKCGSKLLAIYGTNIPTAWGMHFQECAFSITSRPCDRY